MTIAGWAKAFNTEHTKHTEKDKTVAIHDHGYRSPNALCFGFLCVLCVLRVLCVEVLGRSEAENQGCCGASSRLDFPP